MIHCLGPVFELADVLRNRIDFTSTEYVLYNFHTHTVPLPPVPVPIFLLSLSVLFFPPSVPPCLLLFFTPPTFPPVIQGPCPKGGTLRR